MKLTIIAATEASADSCCATPLRHADDLLAAPAWQAKQDELAVAHATSSGSTPTGPAPR